ncbi:DNA-3-methyladenine glycosylase family protein [Brevibacillus parabrevis]|uniref:DNA-3-methyladenine glycosylase family protein n=1 Tax=Brevibacillus parabrevis TaxID=54914 RepID=UPI000A040F99|nr:DNA-3-methyladenine glycosylase [Brevibacillus parabrevis]
MMNTNKRIYTELPRQCLPANAWVDNKKELILYTEQPFSFSQNLNYLSRSNNECLYQIEGDRLYKAIPVDGDIPVVEIRADDDGQLSVRFLGDAPPPNVRAQVAQYVYDWFDLGTNLKKFYDLAQNDALLKTAVASYYGLKNMGIPDLFEAMSWGIIGQQINLTYAYTLKRRLVESFGQRVEHAGRTFWVHPAPQVIAGLTVQDLETLRMTTKKCEYLIGVAQLIVEGKLSKELLWDGGDCKKAEKKLVSIRGIGPWTANYVLMRCLRMPSAFPIDDVGLHNAIKYVQGTETKPTKAEILALSGSWTGWESYATFYLWRFLY